MNSQSIYQGSFQIPPMRYHNKLSEDKVLDALSNGEWGAQEKKDGSFYQLEKIDKDHIYLFGRTISTKTNEYTEKSANVPHIIEWARNNLLDGTILIGEIYKPGGHSNDVTKIMGALPNKAIERQFKTDLYGGPLHYYIFDILRLGNEDLLNESFKTRYAKLIFHSYQWNEDIPDYIEVAPLFISNLAKRLQEIFDKGGEGMVFKRLDSLYEPDKRPMTCFKIKEHVDSIDLICIGLEDPEIDYTGKEIETWPYWFEKKEDKWSPCLSGLCGGYEMYKDNPDSFKPVTKPAFYGWKNAISLGVYQDNKIIKVGRVASGLTDEDREEMGLHPEKYLNKVVEVSCMSINKKDYTLRHPVFIRIRPDKDIKECRAEEIFGG